jgi:predicted small lipoprotein YifL
MPFSLHRLTALLLVAGALALAGCGRKGPLDAPPGGLAATPEGGEAETAGEVVRRGRPKGLPVIKGPKKEIPLDVLLN